MRKEQRRECVAFIEPGLWEVAVQVEWCLVESRASQAALSFQDYGFGHETIIVAWLDYFGVRYMNFNQI